MNLYGESVERVEIVSEVSIGACSRLQFCEIWHKGDDRPCTCIVLDESTSPINRKYKAFFVEKKEFVKGFVKPLIENEA